MNSQYYVYGVFDTYEKALETDKVLSRANPAETFVISKSLAKVAVPEIKPPAVTLLT